MRDCHLTQEAVCPSRILFQYWKLLDLGVKYFSFWEKKGSVHSLPLSCKSELQRGKGNQRPILAGSLLEITCLFHQKSGFLNTKLYRRHSGSFPGHFKSRLWGQLHEDIYPTCYIQCKLWYGSFPEKNAIMRTSDLYTDDCQSLTIAPWSCMLTSDILKIGQVCCCNW